MSVRGKSILKGGTAAAVIAVAALATTAQAKDTNETIEDNEIIVTAQKREQSLHDVPISITAISPVTVKELRLAEIKDIEKIAPNVRIESPFSGSSFPRIFIRGLGTSDYAPNATSSVVLYRDDVAMGNLFLQGLPSYDVERIEVLRGPQGTLLGKNTTGGAINFISARPSTEAGGYALVSYARFGDAQAEGAVTGQVADGIAARFSAFYRRDGDWQFNRTLQLPNGGQTTAAGRLQLAFDRGGPFTALLLGEIGHVDGTGQTPKTRAVNIGGGVTPNDVLAGFTPGWRDLAADLASKFQSDQHALRLYLDWAGEAVSIKSISSYDRGEVLTLQDDDGSPRLVTQDSFAAPRLEQLSQEVRASSSDRGPLSWIVGAHFMQNKVRSEITYIYPDGPDALGANLSRLNQRDRSFALFAHGEHKIVPELTVLAGLRYTWDWKEANYDSLFFTPAQPGAFNPSLAVPGSTVVDVPPGSVERSWRKLTWDATVQYAFTRDVNGYAKIARGYRAGNINGSFGFGATPAVVGPETVTTYELGFKAQSSDNLFSINSAAFLNDYRDLQITTIDTSVVPGVVVTANAGHVQIYGFEVEATLRPLQGLRFQANAGYQKSDFKSETYFKDPFTNLPSRGEELAKSPNWTVSGLAQYEFAVGASWNARVATNWSYRTRAPGVPQGKDGQYASLSLPAGAIGSLRVSLMPSDTLEFSVFVDNVTNNQKMATSIFYNGNGIYSAAGNPLVKPRQVGGQVSLEF